MSPREELNSLLDAAMRKALGEVQERGNHAPFALAITTTGEQVCISAEDCGLPDPHAHHGWITQRVAEAVSAGQYRAVAVARNIALTHAKTGKQADAVQVTLDHLEDEAVTCYMPYEFRRGRVNTAELVATAAAAAYFPR